MAIYQQGSKSNCTSSSLKVCIVVSVIMYQVTSLSALNRFLGENLHRQECNYNGSSASKMNPSTHTHTHSHTSTCPGERAVCLELQDLPILQGFHAYHTTLLIVRWDQLYSSLQNSCHTPRWWLRSILCG